MTGTSEAAAVDGSAGETAFGPAATQAPTPTRRSQSRESGAVAAPETRAGTLSDGFDEFVHAEPPKSTLDEEIVGRTLAGLYRVRGRIGSGGMGVVYEADHVHLEKTFAIKMLTERAAGQRGGVERLLAEARAASRIDHPHIVDVVNLDTDRGRVFIVMERLEGRSLLDRMQQGPMSPHEAVQIARQICSALAAAHAAGVVHRDLKPGNVFLCAGPKQPFAKVLDFGISKTENTDEDLRLTTTGQLIGTPLYISPEQARGAPSIDGRADVYALGVMLFEMLAGRPPFLGRNAFELLFKHGNEPPPRLRDLVPEVPAQLDRLVARALRKDPEQRVGTMLEFDEELAALGETSTTVPLVREPIEGLRPRRSVVAVGLLGAGLIAVALFAAAGSSTSSARNDTASVPPPPLSAAVPFESPAGGAPVELEAPVPGPPPQPIPPTLALRSRPSGATVSVRSDAGEFRHVTPADVQVPRGGEVTLRFTKPGYRPVQRVIRALSDQEISVRLTRPPRRGESRPQAAPPIKLQY